MSVNQCQEQQDVRATGLVTLRQMVRAGTSIAFMPEIAIQESEHGIHYIPFTDPVPNRTIGLVWCKTTARQQLMDRLIDLIVDLIY